MTYEPSDEEVEGMEYALVAAAFPNASPEKQGMMSADAKWGRVARFVLREMHARCVRAAVGAARDVNTAFNGPYAERLAAKAADEAMRDGPDQKLPGS